MSETIMLEDEKLVDYYNYSEEYKELEFLEISIKENGITEPLIVTDLGMEDGKYMIVDGHRRRMVGRKQNIKIFPCIIRHFNSKEELNKEMINYYNCAEMKVKKNQNGEIIYVVER